MIPRILSWFVLLAFGLAATLSAQTAPNAKVVAVDGVKLQVTVTGEMPGWLKKGAVAKVSGGDGKVLHAAAKVTEGEKQTYTLTLKEKTDLKAGDAIVLQKGKALTGC